ncbi:hypothetical protein INR49_010231 [Caranx melampygus]|nr:hypothetical protein INR49_010231 [Caranx melampygus]
MGRAVMVGRGPTGAGVLVLSILIILTTESCRAQKGDGCGPSVLGPSSGTLSSLGYPGTYPNNTVCEWEISVPRGNRIHFRFAELDIENSDCQVNYLCLYNGIGPERSKIAKYCGLGLKVNELINSTGNEVTVQFMSGTHHTGRGFYLSYSTTEHTGESRRPHWSPAVGEGGKEGCCWPDGGRSRVGVSGCASGSEAPHRNRGGAGSAGERESSSLCVAAVHAGVVSNAVGGRISVVSSKGIPHYEGTLANNVTSTGGTLSNSLFTFKTNGCYGTLGLESGGVADTQLSASSVWEWNFSQQSEWLPSGARLKKAGLPWAPSQNDQHQWLQIDLKREKRITVQSAEHYPAVSAVLSVQPGITTTGSTLREYQYYVSAYQVLYSNNGQQWYIYRETNSTQDKIFQGNINYLHEVRNNFIPPIEARFVRINPTSWHQRIALKLELLGCQIPAVRWKTDPRPGPRMITPSRHTPRPAGTKRPPHLGQTTHTPDIRNTTMPPHTNKDWWKSMKQLLPSKMVETEDSVRYSSSEVGRIAGRVAVPRLHAEPAEYAQPLVSGVTTLGARSTFKPDEGPDPGYSDPDLYDAPISPDMYHAYAEPLPASGSEYATPIVVDMGCHPSGAPR